MRTRTVGLSLAAIAAFATACNNDFTSGGLCGNVLFVSLASGQSGTVPVGDSVTLVAQRGVATGATTCTIRNLPPSMVAWSSSDSTVAVVQSTGTVLGVAPGTATVTASQGGQSGSLVLTVVP